MANIIPSRPRMMPQQQRRSFAIVASQYNATYVRALMDNTSRELGVLVPNANVSTYEVPGAFEIPLVVQEIAERGNVDAIIALGVIIKGETQHADLIATAVTNALLDAGMRFRVPVVHEVLSLANEEQAKARCMDSELNRGIEAARIAVRMVQVMGELKAG